MVKWVTSLDRKCKSQKDANLTHAKDHHDFVEWNKQPEMGHTIQRTAIIALLRHSDT
jgi:hypothetical protein